MAIKEVQQFANLIPAGTLKAAPAVFSMQLMNLDIDWIEWEVPPGPRGNVGFWIGSHGQPIIPYAAGPANWIVTDGRAAHWDTEGLPDSGDWEMRGYNLGLQPHTVTIRFGLRPPSNSSLAVPVGLDVSVLTS